MNYLTILAACSLVLCSVAGMAATPAPSPTPMIGLPPCPQSTRDVWLIHDLKQTFTLAGRLWSVPRSLSYTWSENDGPGSGVQFLFRIAAGGHLSSATGWNPDDTAHDPTIEISIRSLGDRSPPRDDILAAEIKSEFLSNRETKLIWGYHVETATDVINQHFYHTLDSQSPFLITCADRYPHYTGPFFPSCTGYQRAWDHAALTYYVSETFFADVPVLESCIRQLIGDLSKPSGG